MHFLKQLRFVAALLAAFFVLSLTACGSGSNSFTWFVDSIPANLDPQVASSASDIIACENLYSGLVRRTPDGSLAPELCERWEVSADRLTYTFYLKDGLTYTASKGDPSDYAITAEDFVFAFQRMFLPGTNSPYAVEFSALENSAAVLAGQKPASALGVTAAEPLKLVFRLSSPDETFLSKLTLPGAMPCDEAFFDSTRGTYGLTSASTLSSGHFYLYNWTSSGLFLRRAASGSQIDSLRLVENTTSSGQSAEELINNEKCTAALDDSGTPTSLQSVSYSDTTWALLFNCDSIFASTELRQALGSAAASAVEVPGGGLFAEAKGLIPDGLTVTASTTGRRRAMSARSSATPAHFTSPPATAASPPPTLAASPCCCPPAAASVTPPSSSTAHGRRSFRSSSRWKRWSRKSSRSGSKTAATPSPSPPCRPRAAVSTPRWPSSPPPAAG